MGSRWITPSLDSYCREIGCLVSPGGAKDNHCQIRSFVPPLDISCPDWPIRSAGNSYQPCLKENNRSDRFAPQLEHALSYHDMGLRHSGHCQRSCSCLVQSLMPIFRILRRLSGSSTWCSLPSLLKSVMREHGKSEQSEQRVTPDFSAAHKRIPHFWQ